MGLFDGKKNVDVNFKDQDKYAGQVEKYLGHGEQVVRITPTLLDFLCVTTHRVIFVDYSITGGVKGTKKRVYSIPFSKIHEVSFETSGGMKLTEKLEIITSAREHEIDFPAGFDTEQVFAEISAKTI